MTDTLTLALDRADLRELIDELYPDAGVNLTLSKQRISAPWRGGDNPEVVSLTAKSARDFKTGETWRPWTFLTDVAGYSKAEAAAYLLRRAGLGDTPGAKLKAARRVASDRQQDERRAAYLKREFDAATERQRTGETSGASSYLDRKQVSSIFDTHKVVGCTDPSGAELPGMTYGTDERGNFIQLALQTIDGKLSGFQRIYDAKCLRGERDKHFYGETKGAFILLEPLDKNPPKKIMFKKSAAKTFKSLPKTPRSLANLLAEGYELGITEGVATGASIALARPHSFVFCALSAGNLTTVAAALRERYGYAHKLDDGSKKAVDLTIWGDLDESGTGQQAAHRAALESGCYVRLPKFKKGYGDFNDLHAAKGLETVKRTRKVTPDAALAFAKELAKQKLSPDKHLAPFALPDSGAALIIRAPQESGKTHRLAELLRGQGLQVLVVTHRESLAKNLAARLAFECYNDYPAHILRDIPRLVICFDSLQKLMIGGELPSYDAVVLDESEQVLEHTTGRQIKHKLENFGVLEHYLKTAPRIICADADAGHLTADTLKRFNPERVITWHRHDHHIAAGRRIRFTFDRDDVLDALEAETRPAWYASDSLRHTRDVDAYLNDPDTLTINSETATTDDAAAYLLDPTGQAPAHRRMVASPSVQTGLSDDSGHWQHVLGSFSGYSSTPQDAMQALTRARRVQELTVYAARGRGEAVSVQEVLDGAAAVDDHEAKGLQRDRYGEQNPNYERLRAEVVAQRSRRRAGYKKGLVLKAVLLGSTIAYDVARDLKPAEVEARDDRRAALREAGLERYVRDRVSAERIDEARAKAYEEAYSLAQDKFFALEQYQVRAFYALPDDVSDDRLDEMLRLDDYKALREKIVRYENFIEPCEVAEARAHGELDAGVMKGDAKAHLLRFDYHRELGKVVGLDSETETQAEVWQRETERLEAELEGLKAEAAEARTRRKGKLDRQINRLETDLAAHKLKTFETTYNAKSETVAAFVRWCSKHHEALKDAGLVTASLDNLKVKPLETIGDSLRRAGLEHSHDGKRGAEKSYSLMFASVFGMCNYSRPRRKNWTFAQQNDNKILNRDLLCKNAVLASPTGLITPLQKVNEPTRSPPPPPDPAGWPPTPTGEHVTPWKVPGYEALRAYVRTQDGSENRTRLLDSFRAADSGDPAALAGIVGYLQNPQVRQLVGVDA